MSSLTTEKLSASLEDYLEAIFNLASDSQSARSKDIAETLGVARSSVTGALQALKEKGLANYRPYGCITLTRQGQAAAEEVVRKHNILKSFFVSVLGVDKDVAQQAACQAEHALGPEIIGRLLSFIEYVTASQKNGHDVVGEFRKFHEAHRARRPQAPARQEGRR
ncbi:MAG: metal-dependent transcriptional regulator [Sedimentisphaerales bacterium]|nr:metal-dependent transcriptional regulator [Sedimentisphaerales bacterium]